MTTLSDLLRDTWDDLGQTFSFVASNGSTTTAVNGLASTLPEPPEDDASQEGTLLVYRDAGGVAAAPEGEFSKISAYASGTFTYTVDTAVSAAIGAGDTVMICSPMFPLRDMIRLANMCVQTDLGKIVLVDTSITTAASQTEYTYPLVCKGHRPIRVQIQGKTGDANDNQYTDLSEYDIVPATAGTTGLIVLPQFSAGYTIKIWYEGVHPQLTAYNSVISETIPRNLLLPMMRERAIRWYNNKTGGSSEYWISMYNEAKAELDKARAMYKVWKPPKQNKILTWTSEPEEDTVPSPIT